MSAAAPLVIFGLVVHLVVDWLGQNEWQAVNKTSLRHPAAYVHSGMHGAAQLLVFPWWGALAIGVTHLLIDTRRPVVWWSRLIGQTPPNPELVPDIARIDPVRPIAEGNVRRYPGIDLGGTVRLWADQVWHIGVIALVALVAT